MLSMRKIEAIKELQDMGYGLVDISEKVSVNRKTVSKYMGIENYSGGYFLKKEIPSKLDPCKGVIESWLEEDHKMRYKQRHTAQRIHSRLVEEYVEFDGSYTLVQR